MASGLFIPQARSYLPARPDGCGKEVLTVACKMGIGNGARFSLQGAARRGRRVIRVIPACSLIIRILIASILSFVAFVINANYGAFGVLCIISFYRFFGSRIKTSLSYIFLLLTFFLILPFSVSKNVSDIFEMSYMNFIQMFSIFSLFFICAYNNKIGHKMKYFFYLFYPLHLFFIFILKLFVF